MTPENNPVVNALHMHEYARRTQVLSQPEPSASLRSPFAADRQTFQGPTMLLQVRSEHDGAAFVV